LVLELVLDSKMDKDHKSPGISSSRFCASCRKSVTQCTTPTVPKPLSWETSNQHILAPLGMMEILVMVVIAALVVLLAMAAILVMEVILARAVALVLVCFLTCSQCLGISVCIGCHTWRTNHHCVNLDNTLS